MQQAPIMFESSHAFCEHFLLKQAIMDTDFKVENFYPVFNKISVGSAITGALATV